MIRTFMLAVVMGSAAWLGLTFTTRDVQAQSSAWCEENCRQLCRLTTRNPEACYVRIPCANYRGKQCAPDVRVKARARTYCTQYPGCP